MFNNIGSRVGTDENYSSLAAEEENQLGGGRDEKLVPVGYSVWNIFCSLTLLNSTYLFIREP